MRQNNCVVADPTSAISADSDGHVSNLGQGRPAKHVWQSLCGRREGARLPSREGRASLAFTAKGRLQKPLGSRFKNAGSCWRATDVGVLRGFVEGGERGP